MQGVLRRGRPRGDGPARRRPARRRPAGRQAASALLVAAVALAACGQAAVSEGPGSTDAPPVATSIPSPQPTLPPDATTALIERAAGGLDPAGSDLDSAWRRVFETLEIVDEQPYGPPSAAAGYRAGDAPQTTCIRTPEEARNAAFYCPDDGRILYDADWFRSLAEEVGPEAILAILAHEWGHHVQHLLGVDTEDLREELQADCYAGMYLVSSGLVPHDSVEAEDPALLAAMTAFYALGNTRYRASEWFGAQEHGSPIQRILATSTGLQSNQQIDRRVPGGMEKGLPSCFGYADYEVGDVARIGPYGFVELPGRASMTTSDGIYVMEPETRTGQPGSRIVMQWLPELPSPGATDDNLAALWATPAFAGITTFAPIDLVPDANAGTGRAAPYSYQAPDGSNPQTGVFGLVSPESGEGGLLLLVYQPRVAEDETGALAIFEEALVTVHQVVSRLCTPDEASDAGAPSFDPICADVQ